MTVQLLKSKLHRIRVTDADLDYEGSITHRYYIPTEVRGLIILGAPDVDASLVKYCKGRKIPVLPYNASSLEDGSYIDEYNALYDKLL